MATVGQAYEVLAVLASRIDWPSFDKDRLQERVIKQPDRLASEFHRFLQNDARMVIAGNMKVGTVPFDLAAFLGMGWSVISEEQDMRSAALVEADMAEAEFLTCLKEGESQITGEEKLSRLKKENRIRYGATVFAGLWQDYQTRKENSVLERLYQGKGITYMDFFGDVLLLGPVGHRRVLYLCRRDDGVWDWDPYWLDNDWFDRDVSAVSPPQVCV